MGLTTTISPFFIRIYMIYAEKSDMAWLNTRAKECEAETRVVTLGRKFYQIEGKC